MKISLLCACAAGALWLCACRQSDDFVVATADNVNTAIQLERNAALASDVYACAVEDRMEALQQRLKNNTQTAPDSEFTKMRAASRLLRAVAASETVHARLLEQIIKKEGWKLTASEAQYPAVSELESMMRYSLNNGDFESSVLFPSFIKTARAAGKESIAVLFERVAAVDRLQADLSRQWLEDFSETLAQQIYGICQRCGNIAAGYPFPPCPLCGASADDIVRVP